jgi:bleomycin hydrolase
MYRLAVLVALIVVLAAAQAVTEDMPGLSQKMIVKCERAFELDQGTRALMNAVTNNDVKKLAFNRERFLEHDDIFNVRIETKGITNQKSSGRCWLFAAFNIMRPAVMKKYNLGEFEFSEVQLFFWDKFEKANMFLDAVIETRDRDIDDRELQALFGNPVPDGGWWNYVVALIEKYGAVPKEIMPETENSSKTRMMNRILNQMARHDAAELRKLAAKGTKESALRKRKDEMMGKYYRILALHLGVPPSEFTWRYKDKEKNIVEKKYTPQSFYSEAVGVDLAEYVTLLDHPVYEHDKYYELHFCRNMTGMPDMDFVNLEPARLKEFALASVLDTLPVWFAADIGKENDSEHGILAVGIFDYGSLYNIEADLSKRERVQLRASTPNHAMAFVGVDTTGAGPAKWLVENSWGAKSGNKGMWSMYDDWFDNYVFSVIIHKRYLTKDVLALLETKPTVIPAWDPMRDAFE